MAHVEDDAVAERVEPPQQCHGQLHGPQGGAQVPAVLPHGLNDALTDLPSQEGKVLGRDAQKVLAPEPRSQKFHVVVRLQSRFCRREVPRRADGMNPL